MTITATHREVNGSNTNFSIIDVTLGKLQAIEASLRRDYEQGVLTPVGHDVWVVIKNTLDKQK